MKRSKVVATHHLTCHMQALTRQDFESALVWSGDPFENTPYTTATEPCAIEWFLRIHFDPSLYLLELFAQSLHRPPKNIGSSGQ